MNTASQALNQFLLALCVWREARGESLRGKQLVAWTILNRSHDKRWPNTIRGVVLQPLQFSSFNANDPNATQFPQPGDVAWDESWSAANDALLGGTPLTSSNHYHVIGLDPKWRDDTKVVATEGHHVFYQL